MREEREAQYVRAIEEGVVDDVLPSRRQRHKVLAADRDGDVAAVLVAERGKRHGGGLVTRSFWRSDGSWEPLGGGVSWSEDPRLPDRSTLSPRSIEIEGSGCSRGEFSPTVHDVVLRAGPGITTLRWRGRSRTVSPTGYAVVVSRGDRLPAVTAHDAEGSQVGELQASGWSRSCLPGRSWIELIRLAVLARRHQGGWFEFPPRR